MLLLLLILLRSAAAVAMKMRNRQVFFALVQSPDIIDILCLSGIGKVCHIFCQKNDRIASLTMQLKAGKGNKLPGLIVLIGKMTNPLP